MEMNAIGRHRVVLSATGICALAYGMISAGSLRWLCDDIYITFRYSRNILAGIGWVYNAGERVEGYTHFLWLCIITAYQWLGGGAEFIAMYLGYVSFAATLLIFLVISFRVWGDRTFPVAFTSLALALHFDFKIWATGGLETSFFTFLVVLTFYVWNFSRLTPRKRYFLASLLATLVVLTRPDGILLALLLGVFFAMELVLERTPRRLLPDLAAFLAPPLLLYVPYLVWKISYYGDFFPNTYYAKSGGSAYWSQGLHYAWLYLTVYPSTLMAAVAAALLLRGARPPDASSRFRHVMGDASLRAVVFASLFTIAYVFIFVVRVGGDFMFARFFHPVIPFVYFSIECTLAYFSAEFRQLSRVILIAVLVLVGLEGVRREYRMTEDSLALTLLSANHGIIDEHWYWTSRQFGGQSLLELQSRAGKQMARYFEGRRVTVMISGQASFGYFANSTRCIERYGLTDRYIAHLPVAQRGRPGHEKVAPIEYLRDQRVNFVFQRVPIDTSSYRMIYFRGGNDFIRAEMITYDRDLLASLKEDFPDRVRYTDFGAYLDSYIATMHGRAKEKVAKDLQAFRDYYFRFYPEDPRQDSLVTLLSAR